MIRTAQLAVLPTLPSLLAEQQTLSAVERFARKHDEGLVPEHTKVYRDLIPAAAPGAGQQYAFEVDLDLCTGCKACVAGCHSMNGLDEGELWRTVGVLHGGTAAAPAQQTVTAACHHCVDPACMSGCPVKAYEKDPSTGIVRHLDDQCIGCQYCTFMCPYDAPKYNHARGIVRKCDMCSDRLAHGEPPACVQSCPNEAIRITVIDRAEVVEAAEANAFVPGAPTPGDTLPATVYKSARPRPRNMLPADFYTVSPEHAHPPLVAMLVLTQLSVGAFILSLLTGLGRMSALVALALGLSALGASTFHLGRPLYAFRAVLGVRTSWLSREIIAFGAFAGLAALYAVWSRVPVGALASTVGAGGVFCSVMVYAATRRPHWRASLTGLKFFATTLLLGAALAALLAVALGARAPLRGLLSAVGVVSALKLLAEAAALRHLRDPHHSPLKRTAVLMAGDLRSATSARFICGALGGLALPALAFAVAPSRIALLVVCGAAFLLCLAGEILERYLFFAAAPASRMPGQIA
jgi:Fe-S-cluster-containing dehydrogenase component/DMSO reductase anchor subunit